VAVGETHARKTRQRLNPDARREAIVAEAQRLLAHESSEHLTIDLIAKRIGASAGLVHHYFGTKDGLVEAALRAAADEVMAILRVDVNSSLTPAEQLIEGLSRYLDYVEAHPASWSSLLRTRGVGTGAAASVADRVDQQAIDFCLGILMPGQSAPVPLTVAMSGWVALIKDVCWRWLNDEELSRSQVESLVTLAFAGCLQAAAFADPAAQPALDAFERR
jgi:AcrR family transcriptional regulator